MPSAMHTHNQMGFSAGAGSFSHSVASTISPEVKSSSSSIEKRVSPKNK